MATGCACNETRLPIGKHREQKIKRRGRRGLCLLPFPQLHGRDIPLVETLRWSLRPGSEELLCSGGGLGRRNAAARRLESQLTMRPAARAGRRVGAEGLIGAQVEIALDA